MKKNTFLRSCKQVGVTAIAIILMYACVKDEFDFSKMKRSQEWSPELAAPLIYSKLTLADIIKDHDYNHLFIEENDNFLKLVYESTIFSKTAEQLIVIPNQSFPALNESVDIPGAIPASDSISHTFTNSFSFNAISVDDAGEPIIIDSLLVKAGQLQVQLNSNINYKTKVVVTVPSLKKAGQIFQRTVFDKNEPAPVSGSRSYDLTGYMFSFDNSGPEQNAMNINYTVTAYGEGSPTYSPPYSINLTGGLQNIQFKKIFGAMGNLSFILRNDTIEIDIFKNNMSTARLELDSPRVMLNVTNSYGIPIDIALTNLKAESDVNSPFSVHILTQPYPVTMNIPAPTYSQVMAGQSAKEYFLYHKNNSNIAQATNISPKHIAIDAVGKSGSSMPQNFVIDTSRFQIDAIVEFPLYGSAWDIVLQDTLPLTFGTSVENLEYITFYIQILNGFPLDAKMQAYFVDENYVVLDSILNAADHIVVPTGPIGPAPGYRVTSPTYKLTTNTMGKSRIMNIIDTHYIIIKAAVATTNNGNQTVKIYSDYSLEVRIGAKAQVNATLDFSDND